MDSCNMLFITIMSLVVWVFWMPNQVKEDWPVGGALPCLWLHSAGLSTLHNVTLQAFWMPNQVKEDWSVGGIAIPLWLCIVGLSTLHKPWLRPKNSFPNTHSMVVNSTIYTCHGQIAGVHLTMMMWISTVIFNLN